MNLRGDLMAKPAACPMSDEEWAALVKAGRDRVRRSYGTPPAAEAPADEAPADEGPSAEEIALEVDGAPEWPGAARFRVIEGGKGA